MVSGCVFRRERPFRRAASRQADRDQLLVFSRWCQVMFRFEKELYARPDQDLNKLWWDLVEKYQFVKRPEGRDAPDWATKIHFVMAPVYYQNYLLGEMTASQLEAHLLREVLGGGDGAWERFVASPEVGAFLATRVYAPGRTRDWRATLAHATGRALDAATFVDELDGRD